MQIIAIDKRRYIAGVHWQTVEGGKSKAKQMLSQARKINSMLGSNCNAVFLGRRQYGLVTVPTKKIPAQPSLASSVRESGINDALLKFCLSESRNLWYVLAISNNNICPAGDSLFHEEGDADELIREITSSNEFELVESFDDAASSFEFLESHVTPHLKLRPLNSTALGLQFGIASAVLVLGIVGYQGYRYYEKIKNNKEAALYLAQQAALKTQKIESIKGEIDIHFPPVYKDKPFAQEVVDVCRRKVSELPINSKGWENSGYSCTANTYFAYWKYQDGSSYLSLPVFTMANTTDPKEPIPLAQGFEHEYGKLGDVELLTKEDASSRISEWARLVHGKLVVEWEPPVIKLVGKDAYFEGVELVSPFAIGRWSMTLEEATYLGDLPINTRTIPGLVLNRIDKKDNFLIEGEIYVQSN